MQAHRLPARHGLFWLAGGFLLYRRNPPLLSMLTFANMLLALMCSLLQPFGPFLLVLGSPLIIVLIANACAAIAEYGPLQLSPLMLLRGLREHTRLLLRLGVVQMACLILVTLLVDAVLPDIDPAALLKPSSPGQPPVLPDTRQLGTLLLHLILVALAVLPAFWFAPLLTAWHGINPVKSVFFSLIAVWRNWRAFLVYVLAAGTLVLLIPALLMALFSLLPGFLGSLLGTAVQLLVLLMLAPMLATGAYCSYREIIVRHDGNDPRRGEPRAIA